MISVFLAQIQLYNATAKSDVSDDGGRERKNAFKSLFATNCAVFYLYIYLGGGPTAAVLPGRGTHNTQTPQHSSSVTWEGPTSANLPGRGTHSSSVSWQGAIQHTHTSQQCHLGGGHTAQQQCYLGGTHSTFTWEGDPQQQCYLGGTHSTFTWEWGSQQQCFLAGGPYSTHTHITALLPRRGHTVHRHNSSVLAGESGTHST